MKLISLSQGKFSKVDDEDFERVVAHKWQYNPYTGYAATHLNTKKQITLHRFIINAKPGEITDHINLDKLDNRKSNLRLCTQAQNTQNRLRASHNKCGYKGVFLHPSKKWMAYIRHNGKQIYIGLYKDIIDAALAYDKKAIELFGEFARPNFCTKLKWIEI